MEEKEVQTTFNADSLVEMMDTEEVSKDEEESETAEE